MEKQPFTEAGTKALQQQLYSLNNAELKRQAQSIQTNIKAWAIEHFELNIKQLEYLNSINQQSIDFLAGQTSYAVGNRLPVTLIKKGDDDNGDDDDGDDLGKLFDIKSNLTALSGGDGDFVAGGELTMVVTYQRHP